MDPKIVAMAVAVIIIALAVAWVVLQKRRTEALRRRFGPEYDRTLREHGPRKAESMLADRERRVEEFHIRDLAVDERERFITTWREVQARFVDDPRAAVAEADQVVTRLMQARGYPMSDFEQRTADISVDHPRVVDNYRAAHEIALRQRRGEATTEDLRNAVICYRSLFDELLQTKTVRDTREVA